MTLVKYIQWIIAIILGFSIVSFIKNKLVQSKKIIFRSIVFIVEFLLMIVIAFLLIAYASPFIWKYNYVICGIYIGLLSDLITDIVLLIVHKINKDIPKYIVSIAIVLIVSLYGTINMQTIKANTLTYSSDKLTKDYKIVFISDLHFGSSQSEETVLKAFNEIKETNADALILGGDITDEYTTKEEMELLYEKIADIDIPTYFIYGNHDRQDRGDYLGGNKFSEDELRDTIQKNGITILKDEYALINKDIVLLGREDPSNSSRKEVEQLAKWDESKFVILVEHTPYQNDDTIKVNADLQLSEHTHAGQLFPLQTLYNLAGLNTYGNYKVGKTNVYVSSGITGWYLPYRTEAFCHYEVVELKKK